jgi:hypothetical protein
VLNESTVKQISDAGRYELDGVLDVLVLFCNFLDVARLGCIQHLVYEVFDVVDRIHQVVRHCGLQHLHHFDFLPLLL